MMPSPAGGGDQAKYEEEKTEVGIYYLQNLFCCW